MWITLRQLLPLAWLALAIGHAAAYNVLDDGKNNLTVTGTYSNISLQSYIGQPFSGLQITNYNTTQRTWLTINDNSIAANGTAYGGATLALAQGGKQYWELLNSVGTGGQYNLSADFIQLFYDGPPAGGRFTVYANSKVTTSNNVLDDGTGTMTVNNLLGVNGACYLGGTIASKGLYILTGTSAAVGTQRTTLDDGNGNMLLAYPPVQSASRIGLGAAVDCGNSAYALAICNNNTGGTTGLWPLGIHNGAGSNSAAVLQVDASGYTHIKRIRIMGSGTNSPNPPDISWDNDGSQDTGIYWISDGIIGISSNGWRSFTMQQNQMNIYGTGNNPAYISFLPNGQTSTGWQVGSETGGNFHIYSQATTGVYIANGQTSWTGYSDARLKNTIVNETQSTLNKLLQLRPVTFNMNADATNTTNHGFIAQEFIQVFPEMVNNATVQNGTSYMGIQYTQLISVLVKSVQQQNSVLTQLMTQVTQLTTQVNSLSAKLGLAPITNVVTGITN